MRISGWLHLEIKGKRPASEQPKLGRFYLDGVSGAELSQAVTITHVDDATVRIDVYRYVLSEPIFGGAIFMRRRGDDEIAKRAADALLEVFAEDDGNEAWFVWKLEPLVYWWNSAEWSSLSVEERREKFPYQQRLVHSVVVIAQSEDEAREVATTDAGCETQLSADVWREARWTRCDRIGRSDSREQKIVVSNWGLTESFVPLVESQFLLRGKPFGPGDEEAMERLQEKIDKGHGTGLERNAYALDKPNE